MLSHETAAPSRGKAAPSHATTAPSKRSAKTYIRYNVNSPEGKVMLEKYAAGNRHHAAAASLRRAFMELVVVYPLGQGLPRVPVGSLHEAQGGGHRLAGE